MKFRFKLIHLEALGVYLVYSIAIKYVFFWTLGWGSIFEYYISPLTAAVFGVLFLYLFSHDDFFKFIKLIEKKEEKAERKWIHRLLHTGKIAIVFLMAAVTGPLLAALVARFLLRLNKFRYLIIFISCFIGNLFWLGVFKSGISIFILNPF